MKIRFKNIYNILQNKKGQTINQTQKFFLVFYYPLVDLILFPFFVKNHFIIVI